MDKADKTRFTTVTSTHLLHSLKTASNDTVWRSYVDRYRPLIVKYAGRFGLNTDDAEDVAQQTLMAFATSYRDGKYDRQKGRLRTWLFGIARNQMLNWRRRKSGREVQVQIQEDETDFFARISDEKELERTWEEEWRDAVLRQCLAQVRQEVQPTTFEAFVLFACQGLSAQSVAKRLGLTENAVFGAKRRVLRRIRESLPQIEEVW